MLSRNKLVVMLVAAAAAVAFIGSPVLVSAQDDEDYDYDADDGDYEEDEDADEDDVVNYPTHFKLNQALNYYAVESSSLLKKSMLLAGFTLEETNEINDSYLDFAERALVGEIERIERIRDELLERQDAWVQAAKKSDAQSCSAEDNEGNCKDPNADASDEATAASKKDDKRSSEFGHFLTPDLKPGQAELLKWEHDGSIVQDYAARVGLPPQLIPTLKEYAKGLGLLDIMMNMLYEDPLPPDGARWFSFQSPYQVGTGEQTGEMRNFTWNVERPAKKWKSDMHWFNTADELSHEDGLRALAKGGFDEVLKAIGTKFGLETLHVDSFGFVAVTNCDRGFIHTDWEDVGGDAFNFLVGIHSPEDAGPELIVESDTNGKGEVYYGSNAGILVGDGTRHGTRECDHRANRGVRITCSIYLANPTKQNLSVLAGDTTSIFPPMEEVGEEWIWSQRGRHWRKEGGVGLVGDRGRAPFKFEDSMPGCTDDVCNNESDDMPRNSCMKSCKVFMDDESEYKPGKERREVLGY